MTHEELLKRAKTVLLVDWPTRDVPETLARAGYEVVSHDGPAPDEFNAYELHGDDVVERRVGAPPAHADVVYTHRPIDELPGIVNLARQVGAEAVWCQTGSPEARRIVEGANMTYVDAPIVEAVGSSPS